MNEDPLLNTHKHTHTHTQCWRAQQEAMNPWAFLGWSTVQPTNQSTNY